MLRVVSTSTRDANPDVCTIFVKDIEWGIPCGPGQWENRLGPRLFTRSLLMKAVRRRTSPAAPVIRMAIIRQAICFFYPTLSDFLGFFASGELDNEVNIIVKSHGRDVIKYYFNGECPVCDGLHWTCPGCLGPSYPDLRAGCGVDLSCPACMGYDFAFDDKYRLREIEDLEWRLKSDEPVPEKHRQRLEDQLHEIVQLTRECYEVINDRLGEMGFELLAVDEEAKKTERHNRQKLPWLSA